MSSRIHTPAENTAASSECSRAAYRVRGLAVETRCLPLSPLIGAGRPLLWVSDVAPVAGKTRRHLLKLVAQCFRLCHSPSASVLMILISLTMSTQQMAAPSPVTLSAALQHPGAAEPGPSGPAGTLGHGDAKGSYTLNLLKAECHITQSFRSSRYYLV